MDPLIILGATAGISALGNVVNNLMGRSNAQFAYDKFNSPAAQVRGFQQAGLNPAVAMSQSGGQSGAGQAAPPPPTENPFGMVNLETYANSLKALADAKKAGVDTRSAEQDIKLKQIEEDAKEFELRLSKYFGTKERAQALALLEKNVRVAQLTGDIKEQEKAINEWIKAKEKAISEAEENKRDILKKELDNTDKRLKLENRVLSTQGDANSAAANASNASARLSGKQADYQQIVNDIKESGKTFELENLIRRYQAENKVADATAEQAYTMLERYKQLNENDKNAAAKYLNYTFWFLKEQMPSLPVVPFLKMGK